MPLTVPKVQPLVLVAALLLAGSALGQTTIKVGQSTAMTGAGAERAVPFHQGAKVYFDRINAEGGIGGRKFELVVLDDAGNPNVTVENTRQLIEQGAYVLFGYYGSAQVVASYPQVKDTDLLFFAPLAGAEELGGSLYPNVYKLRPGYSLETHAIVRHAESLGARKFGVLHASDSESMAALETGEPTMGGLGVNLLVKAPLNAIDKVMAAGPDSFLVIGDAAGATTTIKSLRAKGFRGPIYTYSLAGESLLAERLGPAGAGVVVARVVPKSDSAKLAVVRDMMADARAAGLGKPNVYMLEGYLSARALTEALRRIPVKAPFSRDRLRKSLEALDDVSMGGFRVHFADGRIGSPIVELSLIDSQGKVRE